MRLNRRLVWFGLCAALAGPAAAENPSQSAPATRQERLTSAESYLPMPTLSVGVLQRHTTRGVIVVDMGLDIPDPALRRRAQLAAPRVRDALRTAVATYASIYYRDRTAPEPETLARLMQQAVDQTLGAAGARVLLANIIYQRQQPSR